jgi:DNA repair exonuclease SbcCD ATPase subunit
VEDRVNQDKAYLTGPTSISMAVADSDPISLLQEVRALLDERLASYGEAETTRAEDERAAELLLSRIGTTEDSGDRPTILLQHLHVHAFKQLHEVELWFPRRGSILIDGPNEAGKSTLLEAIYFGLSGVPLAFEKAHAPLEDLLPYSGGPAEVELTLSSGTAKLEISRQLLSAGGAQGVTQEAQLRVHSASRPLEEIKGLEAVNLRIRQEMQGLDGDTLRYSRFIEQRGLEYAPPLSHDQRDTSVAKLIGIERLTHIEKELHTAAAQAKQETDQLRREYDVAVLRQAASDSELLAASTHEQIQAARVRLLLEERDSRDTARERKEEHLATLGAERFTLDSRLQNLTRLQELQIGLQNAGAQLQEASEAESFRSEIAVLVAGLQRIEQETLPGLIRHLEDLEALAAGLDAVETIRAAVQVEQDHLAAEEAVIQAQSALENAEVDYAGAHEAVARATLRATLMAWVNLKELEALTTANNQQAGALKERRRRLAAQATQTVTATGRTQVLAALFAVLALATLAGGIDLHPLWVASTALWLGAVYLLWRRRQYLTAQRHIEQDDASAASQLAALEAEIQTVQGMAGSFDELVQLEQQLASSGIVPTLEAGKRTLATLGEDTNASSSSQQRLEEARQVVADRRAGVAAAADHLAQFAATRPAPLEEDVSLRADTRSRVGKLYQELRRHEDLVAAQCQELAIVPEQQAVALELGRLGAQIRALEEQLQPYEPLRTQLRQRTIFAELTLAAAHTTLAGLQECLRVEKLDASEKHAGEPYLAQLQLVYEHVEQTLANVRAQYDESEILVELATIDERIRTLQQQAEAEAALSARLGEQVVELLTPYAPSNRKYFGSEPLDKLVSDWPLLANVDSARLDNYEEMYRMASQEAHHLRQSANSHAHSYGLEEIELEAETCSQRLAEGVHEAHRFELAAEMAEQVCGRIVRRILPQTIAYMQQLLPELTAGRYREVELIAQDISDHSTDLSITLWDEEAGRHVATDLFSGGTRDQCSLALRLAFALATLPRELGAMPGFIFLDEPLSSFDSERSQALVRILTQGTIAQHFDQVVLISHSRAFDRDSFRYYVRLENGRVSEANLPTISTIDQLWQSQDAGPL